MKEHLEELALTERIAGKRSHGRQYLMHTCQHLKIKNLTLMCAKRTSRARSAKSLAAGVQGPLKGPGSSRVIDALWCYLSLIFDIYDHIE